MSGESEADANDMLPEYDFSGGMRGKYAKRYHQGSNVVVLARGKEEVMKLVTGLAVLAFATGCAPVTGPACPPTVHRVVDLDATSLALVPVSLLERMRRPPQEEETLTPTKEEEGEVEEDATQSATVAGVNLARTSLASVTASSVNGGRALDNVYYGVLNAFDDGSNWHNEINYTYWLSSPSDLQPRIEVSFDIPVDVSAVVVEGGPRYSTMFVDCEGSERHAPPVSSVLRLEQVVPGVAKVRLTFVKGQGNVEVYEVRILGPRPRGATFEVGAPRIGSRGPGPVRAEHEDDGAGTALPSR